MLHCLLYWPCRLRTRRLRSGSEWESASAAMRLARRCALTAITRTIRILARPTATTVRAGSRAGSLSAQAPGITAGDILITDAVTDAATLAALRVVVRRVTVWRFGAASQRAGRSQAIAEVSAAAADKLHRKLTNGWQPASRFSLFSSAGRAWCRLRTERL